MADSWCGALRVVVVADGDPRDVATNSGLPEGVMSALALRDDVEVIGAVDTTPHALLRLLVKILSFRTDRRRWANVYRKGRLMRWARSRARDKALADLPKPFVTLQIGNTYRPLESPYVVLLDGTAIQSQRWSAWSLPDGEFKARVRAESQQFDRASVIFTLGEHVRDEIVSSYGQRDHKVRAVGGGVRSGALGGRTAQQARPGGGPVCILFVGVDFERKGGDLLLEAFSSIRDTDDVRLVVAGCPAGKQQAGVTYTGFVSERSEMDVLYAAADIFCLPSRFEPFGLVVHEAMAFGLPCVVSDQGALPSLVGTAGKVVPVDDSLALEEALRTLARDPEERSRLGTQARAVAASSDWTTVADRIVEGLLIARGAA